MVCRFFLSAQFIVKLSESTSASSKAGIVSNQAYRPTQRAHQVLLEPLILPDLWPVAERSIEYAASPGKSFGAVVTDINNDGLTDLFVANDTVANFLFLNKGKVSSRRSVSRLELHIAILGVRVPE